MQQMRTKIGTVNLKREGKFGRENFKSTFKSGTVLSRRNIIQVTGII